MIIPIGLFTITGILYGCYLLLNKQKRPIIIADADRAHAVLKSPNYIRHKPNEWLIHTLSIVNPFTINNVSLLNNFKNEVKDTLANWCKDENYQDLVLTIRNCVQHRFSLFSSDHSKINLSKFVKQVTLDCFLSGILNIHVDENFLVEIPELIIHLWKHRDDRQAQNRLKELIFNDQTNFTQSKFWQKIRTILSSHSDIISQTVTNEYNEKISNPMNIIVPGWETMWRVVFYSLLELLRHPDLLQELRIQLNDQSKSYKKCLLLQQILKETLRLYPPTKNIYRFNQETNENVRIDVQHIHRDESIWGSNALLFCPDRFIKDKLTDKQSKSYLPFSISCPARHGFAYGFAGAIIAEILNQCSRLTLSNEFSALLTDQILDMSRDSYKDLLVIR